MPGFLMSFAVARELTQSRLKELLTYHEDTGEFTWNLRRGGKQVGDVAGCLCKVRGKSYRRIRLDWELIMAQRLVWLYVYGEWPDEVDHTDGDSLNNRLNNLRDSSRTENNRNATIRKDNTTGVSGVTYRYGKYQANIKSCGISIRLGTYAELKTAVAVRVAALEYLEFHQNHGNKLKDRLTIDQTLYLKLRAAVGQIIDKALNGLKPTAVKQQFTIESNIPFTEGN